MKVQAALDAKRGVGGIPLGIGHDAQIGRIHSNPFGLWARRLMLLSVPLDDAVVAVGRNGDADVREYLGGIVAP